MFAWFKKTNSKLKFEDYKLTHGKYAALTLVKIRTYLAAIMNIGSSLTMDTLNQAVSAINTDSLLLNEVLETPEIKKTFTEIKTILEETKSQLELETDLEKKQELLEKSKVIMSKLQDYLTRTAMFNPEILKRVFLKDNENLKKQLASEIELIELQFDIIKTFLKSKGLDEKLSDTFTGDDFLNLITNISSENENKIDASFFLSIMNTKRLADNHNLITKIKDLYYSILSWLSGLIWWK
jgi:hypothetical protein